MEIVIRKADAKDVPHFPSILRDAHNSLKKSRGGLTPDDEIDSFNSLSDAELIRILCRDSAYFVAEVRESGELAGMGALTCNPWYRLIGCVYSRSHYVRSSFQGGKAGVGVGRLLREATIAEAKKQGFRKMFGYSTLEAAGFHRKFGAVFYPRHNARLIGSVVFHYYEIELRKSPLNGLRIEPYLYRLGRLYGLLIQKACPGNEEKKI